VVLLASNRLVRIRIISALLGWGSLWQLPWPFIGMPSARRWRQYLRAAYGLFPIGWIILNLIFLYQLTVKAGLFEFSGQSVGGGAGPRVQVIPSPFSFGAFFRKRGRFRNTRRSHGAILIQLGFKPLAASGLSLIANTAPVLLAPWAHPFLR